MVVLAGFVRVAPFIWVSFEFMIGGSLFRMEYRRRAKVLHGKGEN
jgi:hypothetical protein